MTITPNMLKQKYKMVPGRVTITYKVANAGFGFSVRGARSKSVSLEERSFAQVEISVESQWWYLPAATLNGTVPVVGDSITDPANALWIVMHTENGLMDGEFKCLCTRGR